MSTSIAKRFERIEGVMAFQAIRQGLVLTIPVLLVGSFCLVFLNLPFGAYQDALSALPWITSALTMAYDATMGIFSLYVAVSIGLRYARAYAARFGGFFIQGAPFAALAGYLVLVGFGWGSVDLAVLSTRSLFVAIISGLGSAMLYCRIVGRLPARRRYGDSMDGVFNQAVTALVPIAAVVALCAALNATAAVVFSAGSVEELFFAGVSALFPLADASLGSGLLYLLANNVMWFFGIHGGNMLDGVAQSVFVPGTAANAASLAAGGGTVQIVTKTFFDVFASIGGAGALLSLLVAILLFGHRRNVRRLSAFAAVPMAFNVSEIMMFGLPVVWNPTLFVPFILVPLVNLVVAYAATAVGLVPPTVVDVTWTAPPLVGGYVATGSVCRSRAAAGQHRRGRRAVPAVPAPLRARRRRAGPGRVPGAARPAARGGVAQREVALLDGAGRLGSVARSLAEDVCQAVERRELELHYQPQFDADGAAVGAEALLRFRHPEYGMVYPPLVVELAAQAGVLEDLERAVFDRALDDAARIQALAHEGVVREDFTVSVNATARMLQDADDVDFVIAAVRARGLDAGRVVVEATEREALRWTPAPPSCCDVSRTRACLWPSTTFSMARTSFQYLETSVFSVVKLDGAMAQGVLENERYAEIVSSITEPLRAAGLHGAGRVRGDRRAARPAAPPGLLVLPGLPVRARASLRPDG